MVESGRHARLRGVWGNPCGFKSRSRHHLTRRSSLHIGIIGGSVCSPTLRDDAYTIGYLIGRKGHTLVWGGMGGVMEAASKGAKDGGGKVIGILPGTNREEANPYIDFPIVTGLGHMRNPLVVLNSDVIISIDGNWGTMSEIAFAVLYNKPLVLYKSPPMFATQGEKPPITDIASSPEEAVRLAISKGR